MASRVSVPWLHRRGQLAPLVQQGVHHPRPYGVGVGEEVGEVQLFPHHGVKLLTEQKDGGVGLPLAGHIQVPGRR